MHLPAKHRRQKILSEINPHTTHEATASPPPPHAAAAARRCRRHRRRRTPLADARSRSPPSLPLPHPPAANVGCRRGRCSLIDNNTTMTRVPFTNTLTGAPRRASKRQRCKNSRWMHLGAAEIGSRQKIQRCWARHTLATTNSLFLAGSTHSPPSAQSSLGLFQRQCSR